MTGECCDPEGYWRGEVRHPSAACGGTSPCRGDFMGNCYMERLPCKGSWMRRKVQTEGCIAALRREISCKAQQGFALRP